MTRYLKVCNFSDKNMSCHEKMFIVILCVKIYLSGCEGDLAATLITIVDLADPAGLGGVLSHHSTCVPPKTVRSIEEDPSSVKGIRVSALPC